MKRDDADPSAKQFQQSTPELSTLQMGETPRERGHVKSLDLQYKPVGIPAVSAAAHFTRKPGKTK